MRVNFSVHAANVCAVKNRHAYHLLRDASSFFVVVIAVFIASESSPVVAYRFIRLVIYCGHA